MSQTLIDQALKIFKRDFPVKLDKMKVNYRYGDKELGVQFQCPHDEQLAIAEFLKEKGIKSKYHDEPGVLLADCEERGEQRCRFVLTYLNFYGILVAEFDDYSQEKAF